MARLKEVFRQSAFINGEWVRRGPQIDVLNPANGELVGHVPDVGKTGAEHAIAAAKACLKTWKFTTAYERADMLHAWGDEVAAYRDAIAEVMTTEQGKPLSEAAGEVDYALSFIRWFAEEAKRARGDVIPSPKPDMKILVQKEALGVVAAITPWNFPAAMITRKAAPAIAAGCPIIVKPAEATPFTALALAAMAEKAGFPAGLLQIVTGEARPIGEVLTSHPDVRGFSFTGSTVVGKQLLAQCAPTVKKVALELGGNAPYIVCESADMQAAADGLLQVKFRNGGQACTSPNRIFVHESLKDAFASHMADGMKDLSIGNGMEDGTDIGPMINGAAVENMHRLIADGESKGAHQITPMQGHAKEHTSKGHFVAPSILVDVTPEMACFQEEIFGPLVAITPFYDVDTMLAQANDTEYGLAAYLFSQNMAEAHYIADRLEYGMVGINASHISTACAPFGGQKQSGLGREGSHYGMDEFQEIKYVAVGGLTAD
jgi:succinate-semialdehyde dehydrogenase/glutarate-semialdehyde dehydrogenase